MIKFNTGKFNTKQDALTLSCKYKINSKVKVNLTFLTKISAKSKSDTKCNFTYVRVRKITPNKVQIETKCNITYVRVRNPKPNKVKIYSKVNADYKAYEVKKLIFENAGFEPGDIIEIDNKHFSTTKNKENILNLTNCEFFNLNPDSNIIIYKDDVAERKIQVTSIHTNYYL